MDNYRVLQRKVFHFDTMNRTGGNINTPEFGFRKDVFQVSDPNIQLRFSLLQATLPYSWYNISDGIGGSYANNWVELMENGVLVSRVSIPAGNYNITQILAALKAGFNAVSSRSYDYSFDPITLKATWTYTGPGASSFRFSPVGNESLDVVLGFKATPLQYEFAFASNKLVSVNPVNVSQTSDVYVSITNLQGISFEYLNQVFTSSPCFCILPITVPFFSNITYMARRQHEYEFVVSSQSLPDSLNFAATNQFDEVLPLNRDWNITLICEWITPQPKPQSEYHLLEKLLLTTYKIAEDTELVKKNIARRNN